MLSTREYLLRLEQNLMLGSGRWVADFNESFWDYTVNDVTFAMLVSGGMRPKGFALSKIASVFLMPDYHAACFAYTDDPGLKRLPSVHQAVERYMKDDKVNWSWVVVSHEGAFSQQARANVERNESQNVGIALVDLQAGEIITNRSYIGRRMGRYVNVLR